MGDGAAEGSEPGALRVDVDELVVAGRLGEPVDHVLGDLDPVADLLLADPVLHLVHGDDRHGISSPDAAKR